MMPHHAAIVRRCVLIAMLLCSLSTAVEAQESNCSFRNTAFKSGEFLSYNLYYNWKFVWVKAGTASMYTVQSRYDGKPAYRCSLTTRGNGQLDNFFVLRDTLLCYRPMFASTDSITTVHTHGLNIVIATAFTT